MKRFREAIIMMLGVCFFAACDNEENDDVIWDIYPINLYIYITDSEGHDLLDSTYQDNLINDITVSYQGETYPVTTLREYYETHNGNTETRYYMTSFYGLIMCSAEQSARSYLVFGEFRGDENVDKREIILNFPDGRQAVLSYKNSYKTKSNGTPIINRSFYLDGQELKDDSGKEGTFNFQYSHGQTLKYIPNGVR